MKLLPLMCLGVFPLLVFTVGLLGEPPSEFSTRWFLAQVADLAKLGDIGDERLAPDRRDKRSLSVEEHVGPFWWFAVGGCSGNSIAQLKAVEAASSPPPWHGKCVCTKGPFWKRSKEESFPVQGCCRTKTGTRGAPGKASGQANAGMAMMRRQPRQLKRPTCGEQ